jgi:hypothetical protein
LPIHAYPCEPCTLSLQLMVDVCVVVDGTFFTFVLRFYVSDDPCIHVQAQATQTFELCAREASQIFGGLAYTRGGQGEKVERLYREVRAYAIPGGSEEIMLDLGIRQALRNSKL